MTRSHVLCALTCAATALSCSAQITLDQAVRDASTKYPAIRASLEQVSAAAASVNLARTAYLPRADFLGQVNRATHNNIFGMILPQPLPVIANISGPVLRTNSFNNVWGTAVGATVSWEPFDFGLREANVVAAQSARDRAQAEVAVTRLQAATAAADAYLTILAAQQTVVAADAGVERARVLTDVVGALVKNELRPGAEVSRMRAELALAETQVIQAQQSVDVGRAALGQVLGLTPAQVSVVPGKLLDLPAGASMPESAASQHPLAIAQSRTVEEVKAREHALDRSWYPRFTLEAGAYARGTGIQPDGTTGNAASGLAPNIQNWGLGFNVAFPALEFASIRARKEVERYHERAEAARYEQVIQDLSGNVARARAVLDGARRVAANTPVQLDAARATEQQATARYKSGLGSIVEVAEAQRLRTQAEIDDALARLAVWRALLGVAVAQGDLTPFLDLAK